MPYSSKNGYRIYYEVSGEGPPLVLIHANPFDHRLWTYQIARFSAFYRTIAIDLRGYGRSDKPENAFTLEDLSNDVLGVCADEGIERAIFAGVSVGSGIAMFIGLHRPEIVNALILVGGSSRGPTQLQKIVDGFATTDLATYMLQLMRGYVAPGFADAGLGKWWLDRFVENAHALSAASIARVFIARGTHDMSAQVSRIRAPTLVINGEYDVSLDAGRETSKLIPQAKHAIIPNTGHACCIEDPQTFDAEMIAFLSENSLWAGPEMTDAKDREKK